MKHLDRTSIPLTTFGSLLFVGLVALTGCAQTDGGDDDGVESTEQALTGGCSAAFAGCVRGGGGGGCATRYCAGACVSEVERCARGGGGAACANKCSASSACVPREEYSKVRTSECGITVPPFEGTTWGEANATCTTACNGTRSCSVWHDARGRALCTFGAPVDAAGNYW